MTIELRKIEAAQWESWFSRVELAFGGIRENAEERAFWAERNEPDRTVAAYDGELIVGAAGAYSFRMSVPGGGVVPVAGVTCVGVVPTHRRRGVLRAMMRRQLDDVRGRGEALAVLLASEPTIYGRFGYGLGAQEFRVEIDTPRVGLRMPAGAERIRLVLAGVEESLADCEGIYARQVAARPGMLERRPGWERKPVLDDPAEREGASPLMCVQAFDGDDLVGYARYAVAPHWTPDGPDGTVVVRDVDALGPAAYAALWRYLFDIDLTTRVTSRGRPVDDPLLHLVTDLRRCRPRLRDALYVRIVDTAAALAARTYAAPVRVVLEVRDEFCPWNEGRWLLSGDAGGADCKRTEEPADLVLSSRELGATYLGGTSLAALAGAGLVTELRPGALAEASTAFGSPVAPWVPHGF
ncbi:N-acetyltransferase Eis [Streptomyces sp. RB5]|uniref:N-acetyltransferase Eis n=1 Tax=Streptomyces smaragdinus TaxID=2585196 RepID=A0A7K0CNT1_9ACTN|nr:GNAT family N-acetyltransferase [Streptomyces smaragdinus]MQY15109.1 N-acetyltransferase Eis [Streptomyces smaragdinus]